MFVPNRAAGSNPKDGSIHDRIGIVQPEFGRGVGSFMNCFGFQPELRQSGNWGLVQTRYCYESGLKIGLYRFRAAFRSVTRFLHSAKGCFW
jgi:hypothetical protein